MLKALELNGFKSFADRTRLAFDPGITVVVGPNGSGKSNVVDAIKWALGSQSVKALRGKEMADVIFSGSTSRRPANAAEVSLTFDNTGSLFDHDAEQIELTRRVYRSGEVEYLVNRQPQRLRDIRDLLASAGMSTSAYCVIEQGKVDALLQSSAKQRRVIFEEAAGVSRFKIKREEAARRLERIEQNLLRLSDLVDELETRLRTVRSQAGRARKHNELSARLKQLRVATSLADYEALTDRIDKARAAGLADQRQGERLRQQLVVCEQQVARVDASADHLQTELRKATAAETTVRERIAHCDSTRASQLARVDELAIEGERIARQLLAHSTRAGDSEQLVEQAIAEAQTADTTYRSLQQQVALGIQETSRLETALQEAAELEKSARDALDVAFRESSRLEHQAELLEARFETNESTVDRCCQEEEPLTTTAEQLRLQQQQLEIRLGVAKTELADAEAQLARHEQQLHTDRKRLSTLQKKSAESQRRLAAARERTVVLEELERRLDGLTAGAREILRLAQEDPQGPFGDVLGVVADLLQVDADSAPMIEIALGDKANHLVALQSERLCRELQKGSIVWSGRTGLLRLDVAAPASAVDRVDLSSEPGVIGRADHFVDASPQVEDLPRRLLGRIWLVDSLTDALRLSHQRGRGLSFVTSAGEIVGFDGTLVLGPRQNPSGLLSRRSELRALREQIDRLDAEAGRQQCDCEELERQVSHDDSEVRRLSTHASRLQQTVGERQLAAAAATQRMEQLERQIASIAAERTAAEAEQRATTSQLQTCRARLAEFGEQTLRQQEIVRDASERQQGWQAQLTQLRQQVTEERVNLARAEQRKDGLQRQIEQLMRDRRERDQTLIEMQQLVADCRRQRQMLERSVLGLSSESAELYRRKEEAAAAARLLLEQQTDCHRQRSTASRSADEIRNQLLQRERSVQQGELQLQQLQHERSGLSQRLAEDYDLDLDQLAAHPAGDPDLPPEFDPQSDRPQIDREIHELRQRLQATGPVNLDALAELESLEERHTSLASQHADLQQAQRRLAQLVGQINVESRQLFTRTLDEIRGHFKEIFTTLFGGGEADIVIEDDETNDVLECGIGIVARPPGKQPRSISLLSGGERTLTCVALLLAVFRSRPSPFCVLDEVDAALDEANIDRFVKVLKEFMKSTQFIVITHSKRTMSCSDTLYGVTMEESGVSKRVSLKFEDVGEDGHLRTPSALRRAA